MAAPLLSAQNTYSPYSWDGKTPHAELFLLQYSNFAWLACICQEQPLLPFRFHSIAFVWNTYYEPIFLISTVVHLQALDKMFAAPGAK